MRLAKVVGNVVATRKAELLVGQKLMVVQYYTHEEKLQDGLEVVGDCVGAGIGDQVLVVRGGGANTAFGDKRLPIDSAIIGIVDSMEISKNITP